MSTLVRTALAALALLTTVSAASATFIPLPTSGGVNTDKIFDEIDRKTP
jgi:hypothetical protein